MVMENQFVMKRIVLVCRLTNNKVTLFYFDRLSEGTFNNHVKVRSMSWSDDALHVAVDTCWIFW